MCLSHTHWLWAGFTEMTQIRSVHLMKLHVSCVLDLRQRHFCLSPQSHQAVSLMSELHSRQSCMSHSAVNLSIIHCLHDTLKKTITASIRRQLISLTDGGPLCIRLRQLDNVIGKLNQSVLMLHTLEQKYPLKSSILSDEWCSATLYLCLFCDVNDHQERGRIDWLHHLSQQLEPAHNADVSEQRQHQACRDFSTVHLISSMSVCRFTHSKHMSFLMMQVLLGRQKYQHTFIWLPLKCRGIDRDSVCACARTCNSVRVYACEMDLNSSYQHNTSAGFLARLNSSPWHTNACTHAHVHAHRHTQDDWLFYSYLMLYFNSLVLECTK